MHYDWDFSRLIPYSHAFAVGTLVTLELTALVILLGTVFGILLGLALNNRVVRVVVYPVVDVLRALPPLVLILFLYFFLTRQVIGIAVPEFWVCVIAMALNL